VDTVDSVGGKPRLAKDGGLRETEEGRCEQWQGGGTSGIPKRCRAALAAAHHRAAETRQIEKASARQGLDREAGEAEGDAVCHGFEVAQLQRVARARRVRDERVSWRIRGGRRPERAEPARPHMVG